MKVLKAVCVVVMLPPFSVVVGTGVPASTFTLPAELFTTVIVTFALALPKALAAVTVTE